MTRFGEGARFTLLLTAFVLFVLISSAGLGPVTRLGPVVVAVPTLAIILFQLFRDRRSEHPPGGQPPSAGRERSGLLWIVLLLAMLLPLGFLVAMPVYTLLFLRVRGRESWPRSLIIAGAVGAAVYGLSVLTSKPELIEAPLWNWLVR
jgi:tripartite tricarboxylate transporter TctB family protein